ncbi:MAG: hypothetical protein VX346_20210 [Planctomycetota bacterium]|nr:hypothetical protein [Planctomycetota bacterium]
MPATEQTWRSQKGMHVIFAISGVVLLASTVWMFQADHDRQWKGFQKTARRIELTGIKWRQLQATSNELERERQAKVKELSAADNTLLDAELVSKFWDLAVDAVDPGASTRSGQLAAMNAQITAVRQDEEKALGVRKFASAEFDAKRAEHSLGVRDGVPRAELERRQDAVDEKKADVDAKQAKYEDLARTRKALLDVLTQATKTVTELQAELDALNASVEQLETASAEQRSTFFTGGFPFLGKRWLELPILDAFNSPLKIDNLWSDGLTHRYGSFSKVRRFDRCTTCHQAIEKTASGSADQPAYPHAQQVVLRLAPPPAEAEVTPPEATSDADVTPVADGSGAELPEENVSLSEEEMVRQRYGLMLAAEGLLDPTEVTVKLVRQQTPAAQARVVLPAAAAESRPADAIRQELLKPVDVGLPTVGADAGIQTGDVIELINGRPIRDRRRALARLYEALESEETLEVTVRRGLPHPYASHPRLDLFIGSLSPHKLEDFACTVCHEGQGSATDFKWVSHTPNDERQRLDWRRKYGWFDNHHWINPAYPKRFVEATCLKCHHDVQSLAPSERFPQPPAPKLMHGYKLIQKYGCFGCHEIKGFDGPNRRVGPDLRLEPNYFAAAQQWKYASQAGFAQLTAEEQDWVEQLIAHPERDGVRHRLHRLIVEDRDKKGAAEGDARLTDYVHNSLEPLFRDIETPGTQRKVGPSLRFIGRKVNSAFMYDWIKEPQHFRQGTRMPQFFGLWDHLEYETLSHELHQLEHELADLEAELEKEQAARGRPAGRRVAAVQQRKQAVENRQQEVATILAQLNEEKDKKQQEKRFEPVEILGIVTYLRHYSQEFSYLKPPELSPPDEATAAEQIARGRLLFQERGCLACHTHQEFPAATEFRDPQAIGQGPDLSSIADKFRDTPGGLEWLYSWIKNPSRYHARTVMPDLKLDPLDHRDADGKLLYRSDPVANIVDFLLSAKSTRGYQVREDTLQAESLSEDVQQNVAALTEEFLQGAYDRVTAEEKSQSGISPAESVSLKGAERELVVADGGTLDDLQRLRYIGSKSISKYGCYACHDIPGFEDAKPIGTALADWGRKETSKLAFEHITHYVEHGHGPAVAGGDASHAEHDDDSSAADEGLDGFYDFKLQSHHREGFIYQKLREPRSYDYEATANKGYNERLRMPEFPFGHEEREAVITFVLGLVAEPPSAKYVYQADPRTQALIDGRHALDKYNCGGCHLLETQKWQLAYDSGNFLAPTALKTFPFLAHQVAAEKRERSAVKDRRGLLTAELAAMPALLDGDGKPRVQEVERVDGEEEAFALEEEESYAPANLRYQLQLWQPAVLEENTYDVGLVLPVDAAAVTQKRPSHGGYLAKYLLAPLVARQVAGEPLLSRPKAPGTGTKAWEWVPPPLVGEGRKVQSEWLYEFLLDPHPIRPLTVLRMPQFNMSSHEATALANYFAAHDDADYPYTFGERSRPAHVEAAGAHFKSAIRVITDGRNGCTQCHAAGDFSKAAKAPNLEMVYQRLRPDYVRRWIARPAGILPYTQMPDNFKVTGDAASEGFVVKGDRYIDGDATQQLDRMVDLLMNWDNYMKQQTSVVELVEQNTPPAAPAAETGATGGSAP